MSAVNTIEQWPSMSCTTRRSNHVTAVLLQLLTDRRHPGVQVHVAPPQPGRLTTPQPPQSDQVIGGVEPV